MSQPEKLSLTHAMKSADSIRRHYGQSGSDSETPFFAPSIPPGLMQGIGACALAGVALLPIRRLVLGHPSINTHVAFRNFVDLIVSVGHALAATQVGLMAGSVYGGKIYLDEFAKASASTESPVADAVCQDLRTNVLPSKLVMPAGLDGDSIDPRIQTMLSLRRVLERCQQRQNNTEL